VWRFQLNCKCSLERESQQCKCGMAWWAFDVPQSSSVKPRTGLDEWLGFDAQDEQGYCNTNHRKDLDASAIFVSSHWVAKPQHLET
jgi:hypothetical protein